MPPTSEALSGGRGGPSFPPQTSGEQGVAGGPASRDGVVLVGLSGSGKSTVGRCLASRLGRPFLDLDELVHHRTGRTSADLIRASGEEALRGAERDVVAEACAVEGAVIATGGGAVIDPLNRWALWGHGVVAWLDTVPERLAERLSADPVSRPLLADDPPRRLAVLAQARAPFYRAADHRFDAAGRVEEVADAILRAGAGSAPAPIEGRRLFDAEIRREHPFGPPVARIVYGHRLSRATLGTAPWEQDGQRASVVLDPRARPALPQLLADLRRDARVLEVGAGERSKRLRRLERILEWLAAEGAERGDPVVAVGGGTIGDLGGLVAALYARGVPLIQVPTTWLAQADSALGGKVGVDLRAAKNAVGAFWPAWAVVADIGALRTLPPARRRDGIAESLKAGLIGDPVLWRLIEERGVAAVSGEDEAARYAIVERSARLKLDVVGRDPWEHGERRTLNLGHTIGHALEVESRYRLLHGTAVALGLRAVAGIASARGAEAGLAERIDDVLVDLGFPLRRRFDVSTVRAALASDKKRSHGRQRWILPMAVGRVEEVADVDDAELEAALGRIAAG